MADLKTIESGSYDAAMNAEVTVIAGQTIPSGQQFQGVSEPNIWQTAAPIRSTLQPTPTRVKLLLSIDTGTTVPAGSQAQHNTSLELFETLSDVVNATGATRDFIVNARSLNNGEIDAAAGLIDIIATPVVGWNTVTNPRDGSPGNNIDIVDAPCIPITSPFQWNPAGDVTIQVTPHADIVSVRNRTYTIEAATDSTGDLEIQDGGLVLTDRRRDIVQSIMGRLYMRRGEWFLDPTLGIPYAQRFLVKNPSTTEIKSIVRKAILTTPGVESVLSLSVEFDRTARTLAVSGSVSLVDDSTPLDFNSPLNEEALGV